MLHRVFRFWLGVSAWIWFGQSIAWTQSTDTVVQYFSVLIEDRISESPEHLDTTDFKPFEQVIGADGMQYRHNGFTIWLKFDRAKWDAEHISYATFFHFGTRHLAVDGFTKEGNQWKLIPRTVFADLQELPYAAMLVPNNSEINLFRIKPAAYRTRPFTTEIIASDTWNLRQWKYIRTNRFQIIIWFALVTIVVYITIFSALQYGIHRDITYVYYFGFLITQLANFFSQRLDFLFPDNPALHFLTSHGNQISSYIGHACYFAYAQHFLQIQKYIPRLYIALRVLGFVLIGCLILHFVLYYGIHRQDLAQIFYYHTRFFLVGFVIFALAILAWHQMPLKHYLLSGTLFVFVSAMYWLYFGIKNIPEESVAIHPGLLYYGCLVLQMLIFHTGLSVRTKRIDKARQQAELDLSLERQRISSELHDDLSTTLHSIRVLLSDYTHNPLAKTLTKVREMVGDSTSRLEGIIWATGGSNDQTVHLMEKMRNHLYQQSESLQEMVVLDLCPEASKFHIPDVVKLNFYLIFKEALKNIEKHAQAQAVQVNLCIEGDVLVLRISDNGIGIDLHDDHLGNGVRNTIARAERVGALVDRKTKPEFEGTQITVTIPLARLKKKNTLI
jgi:signal transduction histidine kinase